jgi:hypothetical protein
VHPALFSRFRAREREAKKKSEKARRKQRGKKAKAPSAKEKKREFALFLVFAVRELLQALPLTSATYFGKACSKDMQQSAWTCRFTFQRHAAGT